MARLRKSIIMTVIAMAVMCPCISYASSVSDEGDNVQVGADFLHGRGTPFDINFRGRNFIK